MHHMSPSKGLNRNGKKSEDACLCQYLGVTQSVYSKSTITWVRVYL